MDKNLKTTLLITFLLFSFIIFLLYLLYCYAYYDEYQEEVYLNKINEYDYGYIFKNMAGKDSLSEDEYNKVIKMMTEQKELKNIYYLYYRDLDDISLDEFLDAYYYGKFEVKHEDVNYSINGKTNLISRRAIFYQSIEVTNEKGYKTSLGVKRNIEFSVEDGATLKVNNESLECIDNICNVNSIFGGLHEVIYTSNGYEYYGIVNISKDKQKIEVTNLESLVRIDDVSDNNILVDNEIVENELKVGTYRLNGCSLSYGCPSSQKSYISLNNDGTCQFYTYITLDQAGDLYNGTYSRDGNFLIMKFDGHTYEVFDYDTKVTTNIDASVNVEMQYRIEENNILANEDYRFKYVE